MKVAIMGAGLSGLVCAKVLENHGIYPTIFEKRNRVGDRFINGEGLLNIVNRPINNCLEFIAEKYDIHLKPISEIKQMTFYSEKEVGNIKEDFGYVNYRGRHKDSFENQLAKQVQSEIIFNSKYTYEDLKRKFDYVLLATGDGAYAEKIGNYKIDVTTTLKGATVEGDFSLDHISLWLNNDFAPQGYAYLLPFSEKEANIVIAYPDDKQNREKEVQSLWEKFYQRACKDLEQDLKIVDNFEVNKYIIGISHKPQIENVLFIGNCFGTIAPAFGFGQFTSILTGIYAAHHIAGIGQYEKLTKSIYKTYENSLVIRRYMETLDNEKLDRIVRSLHLPFANKIYGDDTKIDFLEIASYFLRPLHPVKG